MKKNDLAIALFAAMICVVLVVEPASANVLDNFGTAVLGILNNVFLRTVAIVAIIVTGVMALSGRLEWMRFIYVLLGVVIIFGAAGIVDFIRTNSTTVQVTSPTSIIRIV